MNTLCLKWKTIWNTIRSRIFYSYQKLKLRTFINRMVKFHKLCDNMGYETFYIHIEDLDSLKLVKSLESVSGKDIEKHLAIMIDKQCAEVAIMIEKQYAE